MDLDAVWKRARADLLIPTPRGDGDMFLWEHSFRVARTAQYMLHLPEVRKHAPDDCAVVAAALYYDAGWVARCRGGQTDRLELLLGPLPEVEFDDALRLMERSLTGLLPAPSVQLAVRILRSVREKSGEIIEARVVSDAHNLQEFGVLSLWPAVRRGLLEGKGVQAVLDTWRRKKEYRFWEARLADAFHFPTPREVARSRLEKMDQLLVDLQQQHDVADLAVEAPRTRTTTPH